MCWPCSRWTAGALAEEWVQCGMAVAWRGLWGSSCGHSTPLAGAPEPLPEPPSPPSLPLVVPAGAARGDAGGQVAVRQDGCQVGCQAGAWLAPSWRCVPHLPAWPAVPALSDWMKHVPCSSLFAWLTSSGPTCPTSALTLSLALQRGAQRARPHRRQARHPAHAAGRHAQDDSGGAA